MIITSQYIAAIIAAIFLTCLVALTSSPAFAGKYSEQGLHRWRNVLLFLLVALIIYLCIENFPLTLTLLVVGTGIVALIDLLFFAKKRKAQNAKPSTLVENARGFFPVLLLVWIIRTFIVQPYHVPTGSLEPTVMAGDFIAVNQFDYGLRIPVFNKKILSIGEPKVGDIVLFYNPTNPALVFVKRVVGTPGDHVVYKNKVLSINGQEAPQQAKTADEDLEPGMEPIPVDRRSETLNGIQHDIFVRSISAEDQDFDIVVPQGMYFMMGDNRDDSDDSRTGFGSGVLTFVPEQNLIGKAFGIWMNWDANNNRIQWNRIGKAIH